MPRIYNLLPDVQDDRDLLFSATLGVLTSTEIPETIDLRPDMPPVYDQMSLGSCTANAIGALREYLMTKAGQVYTPLSRLFLYWQERSLEGSIATDAGAYIRDGFKALQQIGIALESEWPYVIENFATTPDTSSVQDAMKYSITTYHRLTSFRQIQDSLVLGLPVVIGIRIYDSFETQAVSDTGFVPMPNTAIEKFLGGHAVLVVGYIMINGILYAIVRNSWGATWGDQGYFYLPVSYFTFPFVTDMWTGTDRFTTVQAIDLMTSKGILRSPEFWKPLVAKYESDLASDYYYGGLAFQNIATWIRNNVGYVSVSTTKDFLTNFIPTTAVDFLTSKGILYSPDFWKNLINKHMSDPTSDCRYFGLAFCNAATFIQSLG